MLTIPETLANLQPDGKVGTVQEVANAVEELGIITEAFW